ncbi:MULTISPECIES: exodeoxyribonuclease III [unclassified Oleiphilus]|jgi:exodeoxyribonuclease-3|uniref:exodeoxyribonuclease III n=5 Tax=Oleiphilus TaxID=141450 RepID=UPI0007C33375|nr:MULTISPECIES: exodeoxyribonuclease III [unclassified Oleiphilus]KZY46521.1 exodeoxyribonuclease III [Oleiphilus sp. HI0050]KZY77815.1 exodeoxyribonuclease III [Oleiphilus sp. HI0068]KZY85071.1 exodeoxyribonuclease III [Oleiphilus sp. HI0072]KZY85222.1 exodeoxyribonuclease III [Oleiphilus sp. HI0069]KZZ11778.1 exodeoxyribonuclease III [Oleiphilus sp. HI0078]
MRLVSWNVNGIRAVMKKDFLSSLESMETDVLCLQETKAQDDQVMEALKDLEGYHIYCNSAEKKGYSGTAILTKHAPISVQYDMGIEEHDQEGRVIAAEYDGFYLVTVYTPNSGSELKRLPYRQEWDKDFNDYLKKLEESKPVILCGDLNVAHKDIDLARPKPNYNKSAGYTQAEIDGLDRYVASGFIDTYRELNPETVKYSWWSYRAGARAKNVGWRIDYFLASQSLRDNIKAADILNDIMGSDHCPVQIDLAL